MNVTCLVWESVMYAALIGLTLVYWARNNFNDRV